MSGHNKWGQIKHKKAANDAKRGQIFSKLSRLITIAARKGIDPKMNISLSQIIDQAKSMNMPNDNIERAIKRVSEKESQSLNELVINAIGPGGVALKIKSITDNSNRTIAEVKKILSDHNAKLVPPGTLDWMFSQSPITVDDSEINNQIQNLLEALDNHDDVEEVSGNFE